MTAAPYISPLPPRAPRPPGIWSAWITLGWGVGALLFVALVQLVLVVAYFASGFVAWETLASHPMALETDAKLIAIVELASTPLVVAYFVFAAAKSGVRARDYLALKWPPWRPLVVGIASVTAVLLAGAVLEQFTGNDPSAGFMDKVFASARDPLTMTLFGLAVAVAAPLQEEFAFRGFLFPGFARDWGPFAAMAATGAIWASLHIQYDWLAVGEIFLIGILFGWLRYWSGSTILTLILHAGVNTFALAEQWWLPH